MQGQGPAPALLVPRDHNHTKLQAHSPPNTKKRGIHPSTQGASSRRSREAFLAEAGAEIGRREGHGKYAAQLWDTWESGSYVILKSHAPS